MKQFSLPTNTFTIILSLVLFFFTTGFQLNAQNAIAGKVIDATTQATLPGATITVSSTFKGTATDINGDFYLENIEKFPLTINVSYTGYSPQKIELISPRKDLIVALNLGANLNEVVVTAQLREQELQEVPIAISVFDDKQILTSPNINNIDDILLDVPGLSGGDFPGGVVYNIRGISSNIFNNSIENSVGIFMDGVFSGRLTASSNEFFDIERVEILKGPQGTLFGRNTSAGAISITSKKAKPHKEISLGATLGNEGQFIGDYVFNVPLTNKFRMRLAGRYQKQDGLITATDPNTNINTELGKIDLMANRLSFLYQASNSFSADLKLTYINSDRGGSPFISIANNNELLQLLEIPVPKDRFERETFMNGPVFDKSKNFSSTLTLKKIINSNLTFESISGFNINTLDYQTDTDVTALAYSLFESVDKFTTYNQEFRLKGTSNRVDWLVAANAFYQNSTQENNLISDDATMDAFFVPLVNNGESFGLPPNPFKEETLHTANIFSTSVFADATWHLTDKLDLTTGFRISFDKKDTQYEAELASGAIQQIYGVNIQSFFEGVGAADSTVSNNWTAFQPRVNLSYKFNDKIMGYAGYSRGYKPGGFSYYILSQVEPETNNAYEVGLKTSFPNGYGYFNIAGYYYDYNNLQLEQLNDFVVVVQNASDVKSVGFEVETAVNLTETFTLGGSFSYIDSEYKNFISSTDGDLSGNRPVYTPKTSFSIFAGFETYINKLGTFYLQTDYGYQSEMFFNQNNDPQLKSAGFGIWNASIGIYGIGNGKIDASVFARNILDQNFITVARPGLGFPYVSRGMPFLTGITVRFNNILSWGKK